MINCHTLTLHRITKLWQFCQHPESQSKKVARKGIAYAGDSKGERVIVGLLGTYVRVLDIGVVHLPELLAPGDPIRLTDPLLAHLLVAAPVSQHKHGPPRGENEELEREAHSATDRSGNVAGL